jgi:hypothetical protein
VSCIRCTEGPGRDLGDGAVSSMLVVGGLASGSKIAFSCGCRGTTMCGWAAMTIRCTLAWWAAGRWVPVDLDRVRVGCEGDLVADHLRLGRGTKRSLTLSM